MHIWDPPANRISGEVDLTFQRPSRPETQATHCFRRVQLCFANDGLETFTMPYCGNIGSFCAVPWSYMTIDYPKFAVSLRHVSVNLMIQRLRQPIFDEWIFRCPNLECLEIALCRTPEWKHEGIHNQPWSLPGTRKPEQHTAMKLKELRLLADTSFHMLIFSLVTAIQEFPAHKKLALGHFMIEMTTWYDFFEHLRDMSQYGVSLDILWLLNPMEEADRRFSPAYERYGGGNIGMQESKGAAKEVRIIHLPFPWGGKEVRQGVGRRFLYPNFDVFEEPYAIEEQ
jgi:hypothetical protein